MINYPIESLMYINRFSKRGIPFEISKKYQAKTNNFTVASRFYLLPTVYPPSCLAGPSLILTSDK